MTTHALATTPSPVIATSHGGRFKSKLRVFFGRFELTSDRVIYYEKSSLWLMFGALGALLSRYSSGKRHTELELSRIASTARGKFGFNKNILDVTMTDGTSHRFTIERYDEFTAALNEQLARRRA